MKSFEFFEPADLDEALELLAEAPEETKPLAGGTDLLVDLLHGAVPPRRIISLSRIDNLAFVMRNGELCLGAATVLHHVDCSPDVRDQCLMLSEAAQLIGSRQTRNLATLGGNICNAVPSADTAPPLLAADAEVTIRSHAGERRLPLAGFFLGPRLTVLKPGEMVTEFSLPPAPPRTGCTYRRHTTRRALDLAMVGVAASLTFAPDGVTVQRARIALGAVAPIPLRAVEAEKALVGNLLADDLVDEAAELTVAAASPISDVRGSADYRKEIIRVLTRRCLLEAGRRARAKV